MEWLKQAYPNCSTSTLEKSVRESNGNYVEAHKKLKSKVGWFSGLTFRSNRTAVSKNGKKFETTQELKRDALETHRGLIVALPKLPLNFVTELFRHMPFPRPDNMAQIVAESWMFVDHALAQKLIVGRETVAYFLISLTDSISIRYPSNNTPRYLNIRNIIPGEAHLATSVSTRPENTIECQTCYNDVPPREITVCTGRTPHSCCYYCAKKWIGNQIDDRVTNMKCVQKCEGHYSDTEMGLFLDPEKYDKLERQRFGFAQFELERGYFECSHCNYPAIVEGLDHFQCPKCNKQSCVKCRREKHSPLSCEVYQSDYKLGARHIVEEAREKASVQVCNKCKVVFEKTDGCNHIKCICGNYQCYVCSANVSSDHSHFVDYNKKATCKMFDHPNMAERVEQAERVTVEQLIRTVPGLKRSDLAI